MGIGCDLVYDGGDVIVAPVDMGKPREDQLQGTVAEQLSELAGRVCYDSLGSGRNSKEYHKHILEVGHGSVYEHFHFTVEMNCADRELEMVKECLNRPDVLATTSGGGHLRVTANIRSVLEWHGMCPNLACPKVGPVMWSAAESLAPVIFGMMHNPYFCQSKFRIVPPRTEDEQWVSMLLKGSRGMSHEQVRHGDRTGISQRSTRFCDEMESEWVRHPLYSAYLEETGDLELHTKVTEATTMCRNVYSLMTGRLQKWIASKGTDKLTARKQARGAARGFLGNALYTELIFSASVRQWKHMIRQRCSPGADAEIRQLYEHVLAVLQGSRYGNSFAGFELVASPDGIGKIIKA